MRCNKPKAIGEMAALHELKGNRQMVYMASKLYRSAREPRAKAMLTIIPPADLIHCTREDIKTQVMELTFNLAIVNEVCLPLHASKINVLFHDACLFKLLSSHVYCYVLYRLISVVRPPGADGGARPEGSTGR
eukprot:1949567-Pleurochrysis_carterae.AAC.1